MQFNEALLILCIIINILILVLSLIAIFNKEKIKFFLWGKWTILSSTGFAIGTVLGGTAISEVNEFLGLLFASCILGVAEWLFLKTYLNNSSYWILSTMIGLLGGISLMQFSTHTQTIPIYFLGIFLGVSQFIVIGKQYERSVWWIIATLVGIVCWFFQVNTAFELLENFDWKFLIIIGLSTTMYGAITGIGLVWILDVKDPLSMIENDK